MQHETIYLDGLPACYAAECTLLSYYGADAIRIGIRSLGVNGYAVDVWYR